MLCDRYRHLVGVSCDLQSAFALADIVVAGFEFLAFGVNDRVGDGSDFCDRSGRLDVAYFSIYESVAAYCDCWLR